MRLSWNVAAAVVLSGLCAGPALAFGDRHGCSGGTVGVATVSVPATVNVPVARTRVSLAPAVNFSATPLTFSAPLVTNSLSFSPAPVVTNFSAPSFTLTPVTVTQVPSTALSFTTSGAGDLTTLNQSIQTLNATLTQTNALLAKLTGDGTVAPPPGGGFGPPLTAPPGGGFGAPLSLSSTTGPHVTALERHKMNFDAHMQAGNLLEARHQYEKGVAYQKRWEDANAEMAKRLKAAGVTLP